MLTVQFDQRRFAADVNRLAAVTNRELKEVLREQAGFLVADAMKLTPPTGNAPMHEGFGKQKKQGEAAITRDVGRTFDPIRLLKFETAEGRLGKAINKLMGKGDYHTVETILRRIGFSNFAGVVKTAEPDLHRRMRNRRGQVTRGTKPWFVDQTASIRRLLTRQIGKVGYAKSGWKKALRALGRGLATGRTRIPPWIDRHNGAGIYYETGSAEKPQIVAGNAVPYIQWLADRIIGRAWQERMAKLPMQIRRIERDMARKLQKAA